MERSIWHRRCDAIVDIIDQTWPDFTEQLQKRLCQAQSAMERRELRDCERSDYRRSARYNAMIAAQRAKTLP